MNGTRLVSRWVAALCLLTLPLSAWSQAASPAASMNEGGRAPVRGETAVPAADGSGGAAEQRIRTLEAQVAKAIVKNEIGFFEEHYAEEFTAVRGDGRLGTRAQELDSLRSGVTRFESYDIHELTVRVYGDAAIVSALYSVKSTVNGKRYDGDVRATRVWVKRDGEWKLVRHHVTRVAPASR